MTPSKKIWVDWVTARMNRNKNLIIVVNGSTGSGKTYAAIDAALTTSQTFGTPFTLKNNVAFKFSDLLLKMQQPINSKPKTCFLMEEVGAFGSGSSSREWQSEANKFFFSFLQTSRHRNQILFMTTPLFSYLDAGARKLVHFQFEAKGINHTMNLSYFKPYRLQINQRTGKIYFKYLRVTGQNGRIVKLKMVAFELPPQDIVKEYEAMKTKYTTALNQSIIVGSEKKQKGPAPRVDKIRLKEYLLAKVPQMEIARRFGITQPHVSYLKKRLMGELEEPLETMPISQ